MNFKHFSKSEIPELYNRTDQTCFFKPKGFWISDEDAEVSYTSWLKSEELDWLSDVKEYSVTLKTTEKILLLTSQEEIINFTKIYHGKPDWIKEYHYRETDHINWPTVAEKYSGIIITPYIWSCRLNSDCHWYYSWDFASGCIWDVSVIDSISLVQKELTSGN